MGSFLNYILSANKELIHSRIIVWLINNNKAFGEAFLRNSLGIIPTDIDWFKGFNELSQIDILIVYKLKNNESFYFIHVENKIKAKEHFKRLSEKEKILFSKSLAIDIGENLSQSEYYFLRIEHNLIQKSLLDHLNQSPNNEGYFITENDLLRSNWKFIFLSPSTKRKHSNIWRLKSPDGEQVPNPWQSYSYEDLIYYSLKSLDDKNEGHYATKEYSEILENDFCIGDNDIKQLFSNENVFKALKGELKVVETNLIQEMFLELQKEVLSLEMLNNSQAGRLRRKYLNDIKFDLNVDFQTDTGNHEAFLFQVMYEISEVYFSKRFKNNQGRIGFQYEHNSTTESGKIKFFFAALDYDNVKISDDPERELYVRKVHVFLKKFESVIKVLTSINRDLKSSTSKSKTFNSLITSMLRYESQNEFVSILYNLMVALHYDLEEIITVHDLQALKEKE